MKSWYEVKLSWKCIYYGMISNCHEKVPSTSWSLLPISSVEQTSEAQLLLSLPKATFFFPFNIWRRFYIYVPMLRCLYRMMSAMFYVIFYALNLYSVFWRRKSCISLGWVSSNKAWIRLIQMIISTQTITISCYQELQNQDLLSNTSLMACQFAL